MSGVADWQWVLVVLAGQKAAVLQRQETLRAEPQHPHAIPSSFFPTKLSRLSPIHGLATAPAFRICTVRSQKAFGFASSTPPGSKPNAYYLSANTCALPVGCQRMLSHISLVNNGAMVPWTSRGI